MGKDGNHIRYLLVLYIVLAVYTVLLTVLLWGRIQSNLEESGVKEHIQLYMEKDSLSSGSAFDCFLYTLDGAKATARYYRPGIRDQKHALVEALLSPLTEEEKKQGFISYIPEGTKLVGITYAEGCFFLDLSEEFLQSPDKDRAMEQMKKTLNLLWETKSLSVKAGGMEFVL